MDVGADRLERGVGRRPLVDTDPVEVEQPCDRGVAGAEAPQLGGPDEGAQPPERVAVERIDPVEQLEHVPARGLLERFNLVDEVLEPLEKPIEVPHHRKGTPPASGPRRPGRIVVGCVGNVLRRDDGFGPAVAARLGDLPPGVDVVETGIGGVALLQELMAGCDGLIVVDAVDRGAEPGSVFVVVPDVAEYDNVPDMHLANPDRVLSMAQGLGCLPRRVVMVGCQPADAGGIGQELSPPVARAVDVAVREVHETVRAWRDESSPGERGFLYP